MDQAVPVSYNSGAVPELLLTWRYIVSPAVKDTFWLIL